MCFCCSYIRKDGWQAFLNSRRSYKTGNANGGLQQVRSSAFRLDLAPRYFHLLLQEETSAAPPPW